MVNEMAGYQNLSFGDKTFTVRWAKKTESGPRTFYGLDGYNKARKAAGDKMRMGRRGGLILSKDCKTRA